MEISINLAGTISLGRFEKILEEKFVDSKKAKSVVFDFEYASWIGHFPAILFYSWATVLIDKKIDVRIRLLDRAQLPPQVKKALLEYGILSELVAQGADAPYQSSPTPRDGLKLNVLRTKSELISELKRGVAATMSFSNLGESARETVVDAFETVLFELAENAFIHTNGSFPHFQVAVARSSGAANVDRALGVIANFEAGTDYVEVSMGDLGPGIQKNLERFVPEGFKSPFSTQLLKPERILAYAFEFGSTSDMDGRRRRLEELLQGQEVEDPAQIATGLFCVFEAARSKSGQLVVRTPTAYLSFDFTSDRNKPRITGRRDLGIKKLAALPGTHYLLRLPLTPSRRKTQTLNQKTISISPTVDFLSAFTVSEQGESSRVLIDAISRVESHLASKRNSEGLSFILPSTVPLSSREIALFLGLLRSLPHGQRTLFWLEHRASNVLETDGVSSKRLKFGCQAVLVGDLISNSFDITAFSDAGPLTRVNVDESGRHGTLDPQAFAISQNAYAQELKDLLIRFLNSATVKQQPGPFLIEGKYYTDTFFQIENAISDPALRRLFIHWFLLGLSYSGREKLPEILLSADPLLNSITIELAKFVEVFFGYRPEVICPEDRTSDISVLRALMALSAQGKRLVVLTDVICTADRIKETLLGAQITEVKSVFTFIDARSENRIGDPLILDENKTVPVISILNHTITPHQQPISRPGDDNETVFVIDRKTRAPTLYVRGKAPKYSVEDLLESHVQESDALAFGHFKSGEKHYSYYLHFPRLFASMRQEIEEWITSQVDAVSRITRESTERWHGLVFDPDGSLSWIPSFLESMSQKPKVNTVTVQQLNAPPAPQKVKNHTNGDSSSDHWIVVLPAVASGETMRRTIELVSRFDPDSMLILCVASRMDPRNISFFRQIKRYGNADLRFAFFFEFPFGSYNSAGGKCPYCAELSELERLLRLAESLSGDQSFLASAIRDKILTITPITVTFDEREEAELYQRSNVALSQGDLQRIRIRSLYERAKFDIKAARTKLNALLVESNEHVDNFLRIVSSDRMSREFAVETLQQRLFKSYDLLITRAHQILNSAEPPFPVGQYINALLHLIPDSFNERACELLIRYLTSIRDVEAICIGLIRYGLMPAEHGSTLSKIRKIKVLSVAHKVANETFDLLEKLARPNDTQNASEINNLSLLWSALKRSNLYSAGIEYLKDNASDVLVPIETITERLEHVIDNWNQSLSPLISKVRLGIWKNVAGEQNRGFTSFASLERLMSRLSSLSKLEIGRTIAEDKFREELDEIATDLDFLNHEIGNRIRKYFVNPVNCSAANLKSLDFDIQDESRNRISFNSSIDTRTENVFCNLAELDFICDELVANWIKYGRDASNPVVEFLLKDLDEFVELQFKDNFPGRFDRASTGGLKAAKEFCERFGGYMDCTDPDEDGLKSISLFLRKIPRGINRPTGAR